MSLVRHSLLHYIENLFKKKLFNLINKIYFYSLENQFSLNSVIKYYLFFNHSL